MAIKSKITSAYVNTERQALGEADDPHFVVLMMFDALLKSLSLFKENVSAKDGPHLELKSDSFSRALTIIYALQSSLDFEKGGSISENLFSLYEFSRQQILSDMRLGEPNGTGDAIDVLTDIREAWAQIGPEIASSK
jgi:flagellar secretion chaperone FliS